MEEKGEGRGHKQEGQKHDTFLLELLNTFHRHSPKHLFKQRIRKNKNKKSATFQRTRDNVFNPNSVCLPEKLTSSAKKLISVRN